MLGGGLICGAAAGAIDTLGGLALGGLALAGAIGAPGAIDTEAGALG